MKWVNCFAIILVSVVGCAERPAAQKLTPTPSESSAASTKPSVSQPTSVLVAAAADLKFAFDDVIEEFKIHHPEINVQVTYGSSGNFFNQLTNKAPFDLFLSADIGYPHKLIEQGDAMKETEFQYAIGHIGIWVRNESTLDLEKRGMTVLSDPTVQKIAIANPKFAPYGRAAEAALKHFEIYDSVKDRLVIGENIAQATQFVESGGAEVGIIAQSLAMAPPLKSKGRYWEIPVDSYPKLEQGGVILNWAKDKEACEKLRLFILSDEVRSILLRYGFERPNLRP